MRRVAFGAGLIGRVILLVALILAAGATVGRLAGSAAEPALDPATLVARLSQPLPPPDGPLRTYHLGHSLVGREMPVMLTDMANARLPQDRASQHVSHSQLGWGASLAQHWSGEVPGLDAENTHPAHRPAAQAIDSGDYDAVVLTEMVELRDAIRWHDSAASLARWAARARAANPDVRLYLYETWHRLDDPEGWEARIAQDRSTLWEAGLLAPAMAKGGTGTIHIIPAGQVMAAAVAAIEAGRIPGLTSRAGLFTDQIHPSALGNWLVALTHFATLYQQSPAGLPPPAALADLPAPAIAMLQDLVWQVVLADPATGLAAGSFERPAP